MITLLVILLLIPCTCVCLNPSLKTTPTVYDLEFKELATVWDEAMPMGNGTVGALVWEKENKLRIALDRSDLWDSRKIDVFQGEPYTFKWVYDHVKNKNYQPVLDWYNLGAKGYPWPTKIPGGALEFNIAHLGKVKKTHLYIKQAVTTVEWENGARFETFVHAVEPIGWFIADNVGEDFTISIVPPAYDVENKMSSNDASLISISKLGYKKGTVVRDGNKLTYEQTASDNFKYTVVVKWKKEGERIVGVWSVTTSESKEKANYCVEKALDKGVLHYYKTHLDWWNEFYGKSSISIPDQIIAKQYYNELYKMGSIARKTASPISLQAVWTADNGRLAPWKGDYHHDLNTELSYWPYYSSNHLDEAYGFLQTLWDNRETNKAYTKQFYGTNGLNVPGVSSLKGEPMGGWIQYSLGPTISAWLSHHFYLHWKYSQDREFLKHRAYPYLKDVATYLEEITILDNGIRKLPLSSSPEHNDNRLEAWFLEMTNFDRSLVKFAFKAASELALELNLKEESIHWSSLEKEMPDFDYDEQGGLTVAPGYPYKVSHRHFSHLLGIHPLGLIDKSNGEKDSHIIEKSIKTLDSCGTDWWCGYSFAWLACLKARNFDGDGAVQALQDFANNFCLRNTFHANGDQKNSGKSKFDYRPFTLEGNMAFAAGVQEMLLQSHPGFISVFPAIPDSWTNVSFYKLRAIGAFLITAIRENGRVVKVECIAEKGGLLRLKNPFNAEYTFDGDTQRIHSVGEVLEVKTNPGEKLVFHVK